jgi:recombination protein RecR
VEESRDIATMESTNAFRGYYFVLGGILNPIEGATPETLHIRELEERLETHPEIQEVILALSPTAHGEATMMYLTKRLRLFDRTISKLARGLPIGASIEYADEVTLGDALKGRRSV